MRSFPALPFLLSLAAVTAGCQQSSNSGHSAAATAPGSTAPTTTSTTSTRTASTGSPTTTASTGSSTTASTGTTTKPTGTATPAPISSGKLPTKPVAAPSPTPAPSAAPAPATSPTPPPPPPAPPSFAFDVDVPWWSSGPVFIVCDQPVNGMAAWSPNAIQLQQDPKITDRWTGSLAMISSTTAVTAGTTINFKVTRGEWNNVEKGPTGEEVQNRVAVAGTSATTVYGHVFHWADDSILPPPGAPLRDLGIWEPRSLALRRQVYAHLPPGYDDPANAGTSYPVLYCLDGQTLYDPTRSTTGQVLGLDVAGDANVTAGHGAFIQIAIDSTFQRVNEYGPSYDPTAPGGGELDLFGQWLLQELKPEIDRTYRTKTDADSTGVFGYELGGLAAFRLAWSNPDQIRRVAALSPLMGWNGEETPGIITNTALKPALTIWLDTGTNEGSNPITQQGYVNDADTALLGLGFVQGADLDYSVITGGTATIPSWAARVPSVLAYLFP